MSDNKNSNFHSTQKLLKHLDKVNEWIKTGDTYPVLIDLNLTNVCNNKCPLCIKTQNDNSSIPFQRVEKLIREFKELGVKSISLGGGGDPTCHKDLPNIVKLIKKEGMSSGVCTNGLFMSDELIEAIVLNGTYLRFSLDADGPEIYKLTHGMNERSFNTVVDNIKRTVAKKRELKSDLTISIGYLVGSQTAKGIYNATKMVKEIGVDFIRIRPFFGYDNKVNCSSKEIDEMISELKRCTEFSDDNFIVSYPKSRWEWVDKGRTRPYEKCFGHHFLTVITADQKVYPCCHLSNMDQYCFGDISRASFKEVWKSEQRKKVYESIKFKNCPNPCMIDHHNKLLWDIRQPIMHPDFL